MGRDLSEIMQSLSPDRKELIENRAKEIIEEINGLRELRQLMSLTQTQIAETLNVKQPFIHKIEKKSDISISTLERFINAVGGTMEIVVNLPNHNTIKLKGLGELTEV